MLLADCDVYYVQLARLADPEGAGQAPLLIVGGTADSRGVVCSASYEVREFGVRSGMPIARAVRLCPQAMCVPIPRRLCAQKSREVVRVLQRFAPAVQSASPDEAYLELTSTMQTVYRGRTLESVAHGIPRRRARRDADPRLVWRGHDRLVAKLAVERAKPRPGTDATGVMLSRPEMRRPSSPPLPSPTFPEWGRSSRSDSPASGWRDVRDVLAHDRSALERIAGKRQGEWLYHVVRGIDQAPVQARSPAKSIGHETTFDTTAPTMRSSARHCSP